jgi:hypothetical protein
MRILDEAHFVAQRWYQPRPNAVGGMSGLCGLKPSQSAQERGSDTTRHRNGDEPLCRVKIILSAFVDDPKVALPRRALVGDGSIDLV